MSKTWSRIHVSNILSFLLVPSILFCNRLKNDRHYKCRFCCALATYFCGGKAHFCTPCHDKAGEKVDFSDWSTKWEGVIDCPGFENCPLGQPHPMNGEEACLGCSMCHAEDV